MSRHYRRRGPLDRRRPRVLDVAPGLVHGSGPRRDRSWAPSRVAVMAHWSTEPEPSRSVVETLSQLDSAGYDTVLVSAAGFPGPLGRVCTWAPDAPELPQRTTVLRRANVGYDFGSWAAALEAFPGIRRAKRTILVNDSVIGPLAPLAPALADFDAGPEPVWGMVGSHQHRPHLQSFFMGFREGVLERSALRQFFSDVRVEASKPAVVRFNELGLAEALDEAEVGWRSMLEPQGHLHDNPTLDQSRWLLEAGLPFVKANAGPDEGRPGALAQWLPPGQPDAPRVRLSPVGRVRFRVAVEGLSGLVPAGMRTPPGRTPADG